MNLTAVQVLVHVWIREKDLRGAAFDNDIEQFRAAQLIERLGRENHGRVVLAPGLEGLGYILLDAGIPQENPGLVDEERFERRGDLPVGNDIVGSVQDVKQERFKEFRIPAHLLEIETLEAGEGDGVLRVVEEESELAAAQPLGQRVGEVPGKRVRKHIQGAKRGGEKVEVFDLLVEGPVGSGIEPADDAAEKHFHEEGQEVEIGLGWGKRKRIDRKVAGLQPHTQVRATKKTGEAFETSA